MKKPEHEPFNRQQCAEFFGVTSQTIRLWEKSGYIVPYFIQRRPYYDAEQVFRIKYGYRKG